MFTIITIIILHVIIHLKVTQNVAELVGILFVLQIFQRENIFDLTLVFEKS